MGEIALSHSRLSVYQNCPRKFKLQYLDKAFPDDSNNPNFVRGNRVHGQLENYVMWLNADQSFEKPAMCTEAQNVIALINNVYESYTSVLPEQQLCLDKNWDKTGWFAKNAYLRAILDVIAFKPGKGLILDYKTGRVRDYDQYGGQLHLNAAISILARKFPEAIFTLDLHDGIWYYLPEENGRELAIEMRDTLNRTNWSRLWNKNILLPLPFGAKIGPSFGEVKSV